MKGQRILVVDDDTDTVQLLTGLLQTAGYTVLAALDPNQALMQAQRERPALILTDILMPAGGGLSVLKRLKMSAKTGTIPIIVVTASAGMHVRFKVYSPRRIPVTRRRSDLASRTRGVSICSRRLTAPWPFEATYCLTTPLDTHSDSDRRCSEFGQ